MKFNCIWEHLRTLPTNTPTQQVAAKEYVSGNLSILRAGTVEQPMLKKKGDDLRIDWGYLYVATPASATVQQSISQTGDFANAFKPAAKNISTGKHLQLNTLVTLGKIGSHRQRTTLPPGLR
jgi:hypothetical protein